MVTQNLDHIEEAKEIVTLDEQNKKYILSVFKAMKFNRTKTAIALGVSIRTVRNWLIHWKLNGIKNPDTVYDKVDVFCRYCSIKMTVTLRLAESLGDKVFCCRDHVLKFRQIKNLNKK